MTKKSQTFDNISPVDFPAFRRKERFENIKNWLQVVLMIIASLALTTLLVLVFLAGVTHNFLPDTSGTKALASLFSEMIANVKTVALIAFGFLFREYLSGRSAS